MTRISGTPRELAPILRAGLDAAFDEIAKRRSAIIHASWRDLPTPEEFGPRDALPTPDIEDD